MWWEYTSLGSIHTGKSVQFDGDQNNPNIQTVLSRRNTQLQEEQVILSTIKCKTTERLPQAGNDETTNLR